MPIVVFWMEVTGRASHREFGDSALVEALQLTEQLRAAGKRHVDLSELDSSIGKPGVDAVEGGRLPSGETYEFSKRHRGSGPST